MSWWPEKVKAVAQAMSTIQQQKLLPLELRLAVMGKTGRADVEDARAIVAINLAYWGSLSVEEIASLKVSHLMGGSNLHLLSAVDGRTVQLPVHFSETWDLYSRLREFSSTTLSKNSPLISQLDKDRRVLPWTVWSIVKQWQIKQGMRDVLTPRDIRSAFLTTVNSQEKIALAAIAAHTGNLSSKVQAATGGVDVYVRQIQLTQSQRLAA